MKHLPSSAFPLFILSLLAGLSAWLNVTVSRDEAEPIFRPPHTADAITENFVAYTYDQEGRLRFRLKAPRLNHFDDDDSSLITAPVLVHFRENAEPITLSGEQAKVSSKGETIYLWGNVLAYRAATGKSAPLTARMPDLTVQPDAGIAFTNQAVELTQGASWMHATGMQLDNNTSTIILQSAVRGEYAAPGKQP